MILNENRDRKLYDSKSGNRRFDEVKLCGLLIFRRQQAIIFYQKPPQLKSCGGLYFTAILRRYAVRVLNTFFTQ